MNSVKNAIVTMTLLVVGYGAYVVLNKPVPDEFGIPSEPGQVWEPPSVLTDPQAANAEAAEVPGTALTSDAVDPYAPETDERNVDNQFGISDFASDANDRYQDAESTYGQVDEDQLRDNAPQFGVSDPRDFSDDQNYGEGQDYEAEGGNFDLGPATDSARLDRDADGAESNYYASDADSLTDDFAASDAEEYPSSGADFDFPPVNGGDGYDNGSITPPASQDFVGDATVPLDGSTTLPVTSDDSFENSWQAIEDDVRNRELANALVRLSAWYESDQLSRDQAEKAQGMLDQLAGTVVYSQEHHILPEHVVRDGETLTDVATQYEVPVTFLARVNGLRSPADVTPGRTLKVVPGPFRAEVNRELSQVTLFLGRHYAGRFAARFGDDLPVDVANYEVARIEQVGTGQSGDYWIGLRGDKITVGHRVGIHVDRGDSQCCIGLSPTDVDDLASILSVGSRITVKR